MIACGLAEILNQELPIKKQEHYTLIMTLCFYIQVSLLSCPREWQLFRIEILYPPGYAMTAAVLRDTVKETLCNRRISYMC